MKDKRVQIRGCQSEYIPQLAKLWKEYLTDQGNDPVIKYIDLDNSVGFNNILERYMKREPKGFLVAIDGDEVVGFIIALKDAFGDNYKTHKKIGMIQAVHTKREYRRRGIATTLMKEALVYLESSGCTIILADTNEENTESIKTLQKQGFKERGKLINHMKKS